MRTPSRSRRGHGICRPVSGPASLHRINYLVSPVGLPPIPQAEHESQGRAAPCATPGRNPLADWSAHLCIAGRMRYILLSNTESLYSTERYGKGISHEARFIERAQSNLRGFMEVDGPEFIYRRFIAPTSATVHFAKALDRRARGSMNDLINQAKFLLVDGESSPHDVGSKLNQVPLSALATSRAAKYGTPRESFRRLSEPEAPAPGG
jgi:hypothetical protein